MNKHFAPRLIVPALALLGLVAACADTPTTAPATGSARNTYVMTTTLSQTSTSTNAQQVRIGDTVVTVFVLGTNTNNGASVNLGFQSKIEFPFQVGSVCDPLLSSYGTGTWNDACVPLNRNITITAKTWLNAKGKLETDFQPALRFVPGLSKSVTLTLKDAAKAGTRIDFCTLLSCINEAAMDPSLATRLDPNNGFVSRIIKHFSGYTITADRTGSDSTDYNF
jgi:hypothetical protein